MASNVFTFGYEGLSLETFIARLTSEGVKTVIDVRANPLSRKRGFSKSALSLALSAAGIAYAHLSAMGCPKSVRDRYKADGDWHVYTRGFMQHLKQQSTALSQLAEIAKASPSCLICFEADFERCHRTYVARGAALLAGLRVKHITAQKVIVDAAPQMAA